MKLQMAGGCNCKLNCFNSLPLLDLNKRQVNTNKQIEFRKKKLFFALLQAGNTLIDLLLVTYSLTQCSPMDDHFPLPLSVFSIINYHNLSMNYDRYNHY